MIDLFAGRGPRLSLDESSVLDVGACIVDGQDLSPGDAVPDDGDPRIFRAVRGFLFTCGPDHIRHPVPLDAGLPEKRYPLHGSFSGSPARILSIRSDEFGADCRAEVDVVTAEGEVARLERHWLLDGRTGEVHLRDRLVNISSKPMPVFLMYHMNIGGCLLDEGTCLRGRMLDGDGFPWRFGEEPGSVFCVPSQPGDGLWSEVSLGPIMATGGKTLRVRYDARTLPHLQIWRNQRLPVDVLGIEPVSHRLLRRDVLKAAGEFDMLQAGEARDFALSFAFLDPV